MYSEVELEEVAADVDATNLDLDEGVQSAFYKCDFCEKETEVFDRANTLLSHFIEPKKFYCIFCTRHNFNLRSNKNVLVLSFRALIGAVYYQCYKVKKIQLYYSQIEDMIHNHIKIGMLNPIFIYDPETFCWFIDFARVGRRSKQLPLNEVIRSINEMVSAFNLYEHIRDFKSHKLITKFSESIVDFHRKRFRPPGKKILVPTLAGCALEPAVTSTDKKMPYAALRDFMPNNFKLR